MKLVHSDRENTRIGGRLEGKTRSRFLATAASRYSRKLDAGGETSLDELIITTISETSEVRNERNRLVDAKAI